MSDLMTAGTAPTMSSREIAELTGSTHDNVLKTVRGLVQRGVVSGNETPYTHPQNGQIYREFRLNYRDTMVVVSGYSVELRARIIDRWQELSMVERNEKGKQARRYFIDCERRHGSAACRIDANLRGDLDEKGRRIAGCGRRPKLGLGADERTPRVAVRCTTGESVLHQREADPGGTGEVPQRRHRTL